VARQVTRKGYAVRRIVLSRGKQAGRESQRSACRAVLAPDPPSDPVAALAVVLPQHPDQHRREDPILLAVDQLRKPGSSWIGGP
jgi:hypothetical protein